ncbi:MAG: TIGR00159 family protein [Verrucomicrobia bacterium]|nr:TIGR00159 family protein [Verrucomicrobiota bacterium]MBV9656928.1 TIGR00159 family protein [Verrucomicrobiota bacterium]
MPEQLSRLARTHWNSAIEILILGVCIYYIWKYFRGTRGAKVLTGLIVFMVSLTLLSEWLHLEVIGWLLSRFSVFFAIGLVVIFQPELRRALADLGSRPLFFFSTKGDAELVDRLSECVFDLASRQCGALLAIERDIGIRNYAETGVDIDCAFSPELVCTIFFPKTPLHDGAMILREDGRIVAAGCIFPVSQRETLDRSFGLRHRAGLGICEETDAVAIVVSEETGSVSLCHGDKIERGLAPAEFRRNLARLLGASEAGDDRVVAAASEEPPPRAAAARRVTELPATPTGERDAA